jgi:hypothetical protein
MPLIIFGGHIIFLNMALSSLPVIVAKTTFPATNDLSLMESTIIAVGFGLMLNAIAIYSP